MKIKKIFKDAMSVTFVKLFLLSNSFNKLVFCQLQVQKNQKWKKTGFTRAFLQLIGNF